MSVVFNENLDADGQTATYQYEGGDGSYTAFGTFGSGTATLQYSIDGTTFIDVSSDAALTANGGVAITNLPPCSVRVNLSGSTSPDLNVHVYRFKTK